MANVDYIGSDRRGQTGDMVKNLLEERNRVWSSYCSVAGMEPFSSNKPVGDLVQEFCELLVDYVSLGHFGIYQRIVSGTERRTQVLDVAEKLYPLIASATESAVEFNDKYEHLEGDEMRESLSDDLSKLGENLAKRIELEDQLIDVMVG